MKNLLDINIHPGWRALMAGTVTMVMLAVFALGDVVQSAENVGTVKQPLVSGTPVHPDMQEELGLLTLTRPNGSCSASLLNNEWAITAAHCVETVAGNAMSVPAGNVTLTANWRAVQQRQGLQINIFRPLDVAIVRVTRPFVVFRNTTGYKRLALDAEPINLQNYAIEILGRGINRFATGSGASAVPSQSDGQFRYGQATIGPFENNVYWYRYPTASVAGGDSGGPSFTTIRVGRVLTGVHALCKVQCVPGQRCGTWSGPGPAPAGYSPWRWVAATPECADAPVRPVWYRIWEIINSSPPLPPDPRVVLDSSRVPTELVRREEPPFVAPFDMKFYSKRYLYAVKPSGELLWYGHVIGVDKNPPQEQSPSAKVVTKPGSAQTAVATAGKTVQGATLKDQVLVRPGPGQIAVEQKVVTAPDKKVLGKEAITAPAPRVFHQWEGPKLVGTGWQSFRDVIPAGIGGGPGGASTDIYGVTQDGVLRWFRHDGFLDGTVAWTGPIDVGTGWNSFKKIVAAGDGVLYAIGSDGTLRWYKHQDFANTSTQPKWSDPQVVGSGWGDFVHVFSTGEGVIYAVTPDGKLVWYRHLGYLTGANQWQGPKPMAAGTGWAQFKRVFSPGDGMIYALQSDGTLLWYQHDAYRDGGLRPLMATKMAGDWGQFVHVFPRMTGTPKPVDVR